MLMSIRMVKKLSKGWHLSSNSDDDPQNEAYNDRFTDFITRQMTKFLWFTNCEAGKYIEEIGAHYQSQPLLAG